MKKQKFVRKKSLPALLVSSLMLVGLLLPGTVVSAEVPVPTEGKLYIHKVHYNDPGEGQPSPTIRGNGMEIALENLTGATPMEGVTFNVIEIKNVVDLGENPSQEEARRFYEGHESDPAYAKASGSTDENGVYITPTLPAARYLIYEVNVPDGAIQTAAPVVLTLPMMNPDGKSWNSNVHVYTKNIATLGAASLYKHKGEAGKTEPLAGAKFNLYYVGQGSEQGYSLGEEHRDMVIEADLLTGADGFTPTVSNLLPGKYYFLETSAPQGYLLNGHKYEFEITPADHAYNSSGDLVDSKIIKVGSLTDATRSVPNYLAPTIDKKITTAPTADIGQVDTWEITSDIPKNITEYKQYVISDTIDKRLDYAGNLSVKINGVALNPGAYEVNVPTAHSNDLTVKLIDSDFGGALSQLVGATSLTITYDTKINKAAVPGEDIPNAATLAYNNRYVSNTVDSYHTPIVVTGGRQFMKVNTSKQPLADAEFKIYRLEGSVKKYAQQDSAMNVKWVDTKDEGTSFLSAASGAFEIRGIAYGDYYLEEVRAPKGYNLLTKDVLFVVDKTSYLKENHITIQNSNEPVIPVTGGIGTLIFFVIGGVLMVGSVLLLLKARKKETANK